MPVPMGASSLRKGRASFVVSVVLDPGLERVSSVMQGILKNKNRLGFFGGLCLTAALTAFGVGSAGAQNLASGNAAPSRVTPATARSVAVVSAHSSTAPAITPATNANRELSGRPYFIEFRARNAAQYGHTFVLYGRVGTKGTIAGFHPAGDSSDCVNCSALPWIIGHIIPVPAETGASDGDNEPELYLTARYRVMLTAAEYKIVVAHIKSKQANSKMWQALFNNCNQFAAGIAEFMDLQTPSTWNPSRLFVEGLTDLNGGKPLKSAKLPDGAVRDAPVSLKTKNVNSARSVSATQ